MGQNDAGRIVEKPIVVEKSIVVENLGRIWEGGIEGVTRR